MLNIYNVRSAEQKLRMEKADKENLCPFCPEGLEKIHRLPIEKDFGDFFATKTAFPYEGTKHHYLIISKKHLTDLSQISETDWQNIWRALKWIINNCKISGGAMFWRFGDMKKNGSSVAHFHIQLLTGNSDENEPEESRESIKVKLGYKRK